MPLRRSDRNAVLRVLAYLLCDSSFFAAFQQIAQNRILKPSEALHTIPPALYPKVLCQTYTDKTITFIWSIDRVAAAAPLDIDAIHFRHPKHRRHFPLKTQKQQGNQQKSGGIPIVNITSPPTIPRSSASPIQGLPTSFFDDLRLKIMNVGEMQLSKAKIISTPDYDEQSPNVSFGHPQQGSTHLNAYIEIVEAAPPVGDERLSRDFRWQRSQTDGFETLREALKEIQKIEPICTVRWYRGPSLIPNRVKPVTRPYAVIHLRSTTFNTWLIEFVEAKRKPNSNNGLPAVASEKNHRMSTMIISNISVATSLDDIALFTQEIILNGLMSGYHWGITEIERYEALQNFNIKLLKHTKGDASHWAQRIFKSVSPTP